MAEVIRSSAFWRSFPIFEEFDSETLCELSGIASYRKWSAGTVIFQRGDQGDYMIVVVSGRIKLSLFTPQGRELMLRQHEAGALFGEMALLDGQPRSADATAVTAAEGYVIGKKDFLALITQRPKTAEAVIRFLCAQLRDTTDRLETIALYDLNARVARFFLATLRQIHGSEMPQSVNLRLTLSQTDIASILGASRPKVNRAILSLEESGAIKRADGIICCNVGRLLSIADPEED
ncbi:cyclic nucleotide-binding domain-containing protein [Sinorhizobium meliloti]|uniref:Crp/Fnr family transcriptional regulator n=1 Tax=Rhizobium meliloti TaxID=382 RepID=UPI000FD9E7F4|nr:Crp/Fnr family transcriptional regulator [Sinorhizobium meliloti]MDW9920637.1 cyclic nucleotide-binding domain-containing protein [Sinorhizobium meliloti]MDX0031784.1 cyclic nucleotide-binding domain-containing protein [Sinorhizobium meliloti]RVL57956.1 Crp/Fnr family transcriptional regulator [Sinorhizobium meliloti]